MPKTHFPHHTAAAAFGRRLISLMESQNHKRRGAGAYLHRKYGVSNVVANAWLNGEYKPEIPLARRIAEDHGITFDELYWGDKPKQPEPNTEDYRDMKDELQQKIEALSTIILAMAVEMRRYRPVEAGALAKLTDSEVVPEEVRGAWLVQALRKVLLTTEESVAELVKTELKKAELDISSDNKRPKQTPKRRRQS